MADDDRQQGRRTEDEETRGFRISLPPIRLPDFFPAGFDPSLEPPERVRTARASPRTVLAAAVLLDAADAALALSGSGGGVPTLVVTLLGAVFLGFAGLLNLWELLAPAPLGAVPTLAALASLQLRGEFHVLGGGHPEHVEADAQREGEAEQRDE